MDHERLLVDYYKSKLEVGNVYSIKAALLDIEMAEQVPRVTMLELCDHVSAAAAAADPDGEYLQPDSVFFEVVSNRPERKVGHSVAVVAERSHIVFVKFLGTVATRSQEAALAHGSGSHGRSNGF